MLDCPTRQVLISAWGKMKLCSCCLSFSSTDEIEVMQLLKNYYGRNFGSSNYGLGGISAPPKRSDDRSRTRPFPNPLPWKGCRFDSAAGCPRASLRPEDLVGQVLGDLDETMWRKKLQQQLRSLLSELGQRWLWVHYGESKFLRCCGGRSCLRNPRTIWSCPWMPTCCCWVPEAPLCWE